MRFKFQHMQYCNYNALLLSLLNGIVKFKGVAELHSWSWVFLILNEIIFRLCTTFLVFSVWTPCSRLETRVCCASITGRRGKQKSQWMPLDSRSQEQRSAVRYWRQVQQCLQCRFHHLICWIVTKVNEWWVKFSWTALLTHYWKSWSFAFHLALQLTLEGKRVGTDLV